MACNLTAVRLVLVMTDLSGDTYELYYRQPTNMERVGFSNTLSEKKGKKTVYKENVFAEQAIFGKMLCLGFSEGYFMDGDKFISSDKSNPNYREDWKQLIEVARPTDFQQIAIAVTRPASPGAADDEPDSASEGEETVGEDATNSMASKLEPEAPLATSSEGS